MLVAIHLCLPSCCEPKAASGAFEGRVEEQEEWAGVEALDTEEEPVEAELRLPAYDGTFSDYSTIVLQYGYITMFVAALPAVVFLAMVEVLLQIRTDRCGDHTLFGPAFGPAGRHTGSCLP